MFERAKYNGQPPISPFYLAALPLALLAAWRDPRQRRLLAFAAAYAFACLALPADARYLVPALPLLSRRGGGSCWRRWLGPLSAPRRTAAVCVVCFLPGWLYAFYRFHRAGSAAADGRQRREAYLARWQPCYPAVSYLNRTLGSGYAVWALHAENMTYYARGRFLGDWIGLGRLRPRARRSARSRRSSTTGCAGWGRATCCCRGSGRGWPCRSRRTPPSSAGSSRSTRTPTPASTGCGLKGREMEAYRHVPGF